MAEGLQAGRLEVQVVADLSGFAQRLRTAVETAAEGLAAKVKVEIDSKGLKRRLKEVVKEASKGVTAKVRVEIDEDRFRASSTASAAVSTTPTSTFPSGQMATATVRRAGAARRAARAHQRRPG